MPEWRNLLVLTKRRSAAGDAGRSAEEEQRWRQLAERAQNLAVQVSLHIGDGVMPMFDLRDPQLAKRAENVNAWLRDVVDRWNGH